VKKFEVNECFSEKGPLLPDMGSAFWTPCGTPLTQRTELDLSLQSLIRSCLPGCNIRA